MAVERDAGVWAMQLVDQHRVPDGTGNMVKVDTIKDGLKLYIEDRMKRRKPITDDEMQGFFMGNRVLFPNQIDISHVPFFTQLANDQNAVNVYGEQLALEGVPGRSPSTVIRIATNKKLLGFIQRSTRYLYIKRYVSLSGNIAMSGKRIAAEVAAYKLSQLLGLDIVPKTKIVRYQNLVYAGQDAIAATYIQGSSSMLSENEVQALLDHSLWQKALSELHLFDYIGSILDRHPANIFFDLTKYKLRAIDHDMGFSFVLPVYPINSRFISGGRLPRVYSTRLQHKIRRLSITKLQKKLRNVLPDDMIEAIWLRVKIVQADIAQKNS